MRSSRFPVIAFALSVGIFLAVMAAAPASLPGSVASHFNAAGQADGWMTRDAYLTGMGVTGLGLALFVIGIFYVIRFIPPSFVNLPRKEYWLAPERRSATNAFLFRSGLWVAVGQIWFFLALHLLTVAANASQPARLSSWVWPLTALFLALLVGWIISLCRRFSRTS